jgi:hypothetical protein
MASEGGLSLVQRLLVVNLGAGTIGLAGQAFPGALPELLVTGSRCRPPGAHDLAAKMACNALT